MPPADPKNLEQVYLASFPNGSLDPSVDKLGLGPMKIGHTDVAGIDPTASPENGAFLLGVTNPSAAFAETYSGLFVTPVKFGPGAVFSARASFIGPAGPFPGPGVTWVVGLTVRHGGVVANINEPRAGVTLQVRAGGVRLNIPGSDPAPNLDNMEQDRFDTIFDPDDPAPIMLELLVDRTTGTGKATIKIGDFPEVTHTATFRDFKANSGPTITAIGPVIVVARPPGTRASVKVRDFRLFVPRT